MSSDQETWKPLPGHEGWVDASSHGQLRRWYEMHGRLVRRLDEPALVKTLSKDGCLYRSVSLRNADGPTGVWSLHKAVLTAFFGHRPSALYVCCHFPDADGTNCAVNNLRWDDYRENSADEIAHRTQDPLAVVARLEKLRVRFPHLRSDVAGISYGRRIGRLPGVYA